jgi:hypothetical protein
MADYFSPTVVQPSIPIADMTPIERLVLSLIFDAEPDGDALYLHAAFGPSDMLTVSREELQEALNASSTTNSAIADYAAERLAAASPDDIGVDLDFSCTPCEVILQDIVRRSETLDYVTLVSAFTCSKMRPDGFGGMATLITADTIRGKSTSDFLEELLADHTTAASAAATG